MEGGEKMAEKTFRERRNWLIEQSTTLIWPGRTSIVNHVTPSEWLALAQEMIDNPEVPESIIVDLDHRARMVRERGVDFKPDSIAI
jgi:hypothetical protein